MREFSLETLTGFVKFDLDESEKELDGSYLDSFLTLAQEIKKIDTHHIQPTTQVSDRIQPLRKDEVTEKDCWATYQKNAPYVQNGFYLVPRIID